MSTIPYGRQYIDADDIEAVVETLKSDFLTQGPKVPEFEAAISNYVGSNFTVAVSSATAALHIACLALDVGPNDWVWTSPISFVASANCAIYCGAKVDFVDIDARSFNLCPIRLKEKLEKAKLEDKLPKVVIPIHMAGSAPDLSAIHELSKEYGFKVIEDASHAIGAKMQNSKVGACEYSDITVFSFHPVKIITTGEGGACTTNNKNLANRMQRLRSHGITRNQDEMTEASHGPWYYQQVELGFNYRLTDLQAALGISQLKKIENAVARRNQIVSRYNNEFESHVVTPLIPSMGRSAFHLYIVQLDEEMTNTKKSKLALTLRENGVGSNLHYIPIHTQPYYRQFGFKLGDYPISESYYRRALSLPLFPSMTEEQITHVIQTFKKSISEL
ncbi:MAG: UDP-4-amino-4,6-dideoxy-N-acetyl-beta-L-altrosamine transaminase [Bdellovibrionales bacterium]|nr:UDP-4-amino-4,6-dideoxy-N-acetyl-beta-L-altrosamine transaminase [Bdellovibrionales bacterium]